MTVIERDAPAGGIRRGRGKGVPPAPRPAPPGRLSTGAPDPAARGGSPTAGVVDTGDLCDLALVALIGKLGFAAELWRPSQTSTPAVLVVRDLTGFDQIPSGVRAEVPVVLIDHRHQPEVDLPGTVTVGVGPDGPARLTAVLTAVLGAEAGRKRVHLSAREREVLTHYVLGATVAETARRCFAAESTIRTHYRRVAQRYQTAGRPVGNKAHLLLYMVADGWIDLDSSADLLAK